MYSVNYETHMCYGREDEPFDHTLYICIQDSWGLCVESLLMKHFQHRDRAVTDSNHVIRMTAPSTRIKTKLKGLGGGDWKGLKNFITTLENNCETIPLPWLEVEMSLSILQTHL